MRPSLSRRIGGCLKSSGTIRLSLRTVDAFKGSGVATVKAAESFFQTSNSATLKCNSLFIMRWRRLSRNITEATTVENTSMTSMPERPT
jgi:hypothetical protein